MRCTRGAKREAEVGLEKHIGEENEWGDWGWAKRKERDEEAAV